MKTLTPLFYEDPLIFPTPPPAGPAGPFFVFYATRRQDYMMWFFASILIWHATHSGSNSPTHPYKYIFSPLFMCSQQLSVSHWINNLLIQKIYFTVFHSVFAFKYFWLVEVTYLLIRFIKTRFFPWNTKNTDRYGVNKEITHTPPTHRKKRVS